MDYPIETLCQALKVSRSAYYAYVKGDTYVLKAEKAILAEKVLHTFECHKRRYGSRRISKTLQQEEGISIGRYAIRGYMKAQGLKAIQPKSFVPKTTDSRHKLGYASNLLKDSSFPDAPDQVYVGDITYLPTSYGKWLFLSSWMDLYSRSIVGWKVDTHMEESLVRDSLKMAFYKRNPPKGLIIHSDRGGQYCSDQFRGLLYEHQCKQSMSRADNAYDNAYAESFFSRFKAELMTDKKVFDSKEQAIKEIFEFIEMYYNTKRLHSSLNYNSPQQFEKMYYDNPVECDTFAHPLYKNDSLRGDDTHRPPF